MKQTAIDWELVQSRLRASERAMEEALAESPARIEAVYRQRAVRLANKQTDLSPASAGLPVLVFRLAQERYAIELKELAEVLPFARCAAVPGAPPRFLGVINVRGELRAVLDLCRLFGLSEDAGNNLGFVLVLRGREREIGLKVDRIEELREIRPEALTFPVQGKYSKGLAAGAVTLVDIDAVLAEVFFKGEFSAA
jgi:purine-binding chemotaxis protein CheW